MRLLHHEFGVVVVDLPTQQPLHSASHLVAAAHHACDVISRLVPQGQATVPPLAVRHHEGVLDDPVVLANVLV